MSAGIAPLFTTAPRLRLLVNDQSAAYAIGFNINISVDVQTVYIIGQISATSTEPTMYNVVTGTIQITKLMPASQQINQRANVLPNEDTLGGATSDVAVAKGGPNINPSNRTGVNNVQAGFKSDSNSLLSLQNLSTHLDPAKVLTSRTFDMDVYLTVPVANSFDTTNAAAGQTELQRWFRIKYCRLNSRNTNISIGALVNEPVNFQGLLATPVMSDTEMFALDSLLAEKL